jgi:predicted ATPase/class 3 adenylate cyclase
MPDLPSGTVTFLFTDIEGSTVRWERHPAAMRAALARHDALLHAGIAAHYGVVLTERGEGDSFFALFARATDALAAACALQRALATEPWPPEVAPIRVRMALHTGEAGVREGSDHRGPAVNRCARLRAIAHGGQTVLSQVTHALVRDSLPPGAELRDLGEHRLAGLQRPERVYQLLADGVPADFLPLRSLDARPSNLPLHLTSFVGRAAEIAAITQALASTRLVTLTGSGGVGKTRLALAVATELVDQYPDGVWLVELAPLTDRGVVPGSVAQALGVREEPGRPLVATLTDFVTDRRLLLVLDNCEQVVGACAALTTALLGVAPGLQVLTTSREALRIRGERVYRVAPLAVPRPPLPGLAVLSDYEAVRLFIVRAQEVQPDFAVTDASAPAVVEICARLDGLPLAIELVAARSRLLSPEALLARLGERLRVATGGARDLPDRQRTLRATMDWSYDLLELAEQTLFARLAVFVGGCTPAAIEAVCDPEGELGIDALDGVQSLLDKSLVQRTDAAQGEPRLVLLETVHEYARERLAASGEQQVLRDWHLAYYLALAEKAAPLLIGPEQGRWLDRLEAEHDNLRVALGWCTGGGGGAEAGLRLAAALGRFWSMRGQWSEGRYWLEQSLRAGTGGAAVLRAGALRAAGGLALYQSDFPEARARYEESLSLCRELGDRQGLHGVINLGSVAAYQGDFRAARALFEEGLALGREAGDKRAMGIALYGLGNVAMYQGDYTGARACHEESLTLLQEVGDRDSIGYARGYLGTVARYQGDFPEARARYEESLSLFRELGDQQGMGDALYGLGFLAAHEGRFPEARALFEEHLTLRREMGDRFGVAEGLDGLGYLAFRQGDDRRARSLYTECLIRCQSLGSTRLTTEVLEGLAGVAVAQGQAGRAAVLLAAAAALGEATGVPVPPSRRADYDRTVAAAGAALGEAAFAAAWTEGRALVPEGAIALALEAGPAG